MSEVHGKQWYPAAKADQQPSAWWYFGRAVYVSRRDYQRIFRKFLTVGIPLGAAGVLLHIPVLLQGAYLTAWVGIALLIYSLFGLYRMYGHPAVQYLSRLLEMGNVAGPVTVADLHIGTYRHAYTLAGLLPQATIYSIDCWNVEGPAAEEAVEDVRALEPPPTDNSRIHPLKADHYRLPLADSSCDVVVLGFGTHEIPEDGPRETLFNEAERVLRPGGSALLFEHGKDLHNFVIFGPVIGHVTTKDDWVSVMNAHFADVRTGRTSHAVDLYAGVRRA